MARSSSRVFFAIPYNFSRTHIYKYDYNLLPADGFRCLAGISPVQNFFLPRIAIEKVVNEVSAMAPLKMKVIKKLFPVTEMIILRTNVIPRSLQPLVDLSSI